MSGAVAQRQRIDAGAVPRRRFTAYALLYFLGLVALPVLGLGLALDAALFILFDRLLGSCYGIFCLFGG